MSRTLVVSAVQTAAHNRTALSDVWPRIAQSVREAASSGAKLVVLPEGTLPAYVLGYERYDGSEIAAALEQCAQLARTCEIVLVVGAARAAEKGVFNSAIVIDADGSIAGAADKHFLWHFDRQWFAPGERLQPVRTSIGVIGALVCADGRISTIARTLVDRGAEILVMPTAWVTSGRDPSALENIQADLLARVRARENGVPFVAANKCGVESDCVAYCGKSQIVAADGSLKAVAPQDAPAILTAAVEIGDPLPPRPALAALRNPARRSRNERATRVALSASDYSADSANERLRILEAAVLVMPGGAHGGDLLAAPVTDAEVWDPGYLAARRLEGYDIAIWRTGSNPEWQVTFARARALELKMYVIVIDAQRERAFAIDPDGTVLCGTFDGYRIAGFSYDPLRTEQTLVAPGTDVRAGLERAYSDASR